MKLYIAGPMTGIPYFNEPLFDAAQKMLEEQGHIVFNPAENDRRVFGEDCLSSNPEGDAALAKEKYGINIRDCLRHDLTFILDHAEGLAMLPGWEYSTGSRVEHALGVALRLQFLYLYTD